jgi:hypothetical protein
LQIVLREENAFCNAHHLSSLHSANGSKDLNGAKYFYVNVFKRSSSMDSVPAWHVYCAEGRSREIFCLDGG